MYLSAVLMRSAIRHRDRNSLRIGRWYLRFFSVPVGLCIALAISAPRCLCQVGLSTAQNVAAGQRFPADKAKLAKRSKPYSEEREKMLGNSLAGVMESRVRVLADPVVDDYLTRLTGRLAVTANVLMPSHVRVVLDPKVNAYSIPGHIYLNSGLLGAIQNEAELAGAIAHELGHLYTHHSVHTLMRLRRGLPLRQFKCRSEFEADRLAVHYMYLAGYDPLAFARFMERVWPASGSASHSIIMQRTFEMYPPPKERIQRIRAVVAHSIPASGSYTADRSEFQTVKLRVLFLVQKETLHQQNRVVEKGAPAGVNNSWSLSRVP